MDLYMYRREKSIYRYTMLLITVFYLVIFITENGNTFHTGTERNMIEIFDLVCT